MAQNTNYEVTSFLDEEKKLTQNKEVQKVSSREDIYKKSVQANNTEHRGSFKNRNKILNNVASRPVLDVRNITKKYKSRTAVDNISFAIYPRQIVGFLGANGAGKSTTIKLLCGLAKADAGDIYIYGNSIKTRFAKAIQNVGAMIEIPQFFPYLSGFNNLKYFQKIGGKYNKEKIEEVATLVGLSGRIHDKFGKYSLGMKQRLGVAQALLGSPKLLILDEPTNGLDANGIREFRLMLQSLARKSNLAILISSHILGEMENLCNNIIIIDKGKIIVQKSMHDIKEEIRQNGKYFITSNAPNYAAKLIVENFKYDVKVKGNSVYISQNINLEQLGKAIALLTKKRIQIEGAGESEQSLEDIFLTMINRGNPSTSIS